MEKGGQDEGEVEMEGEESGSESHWDVVGFKEKSGGGGMETGNQLFGLLFWLCMQRD